MRALIKECKLLGVALNPIIVNSMILDVIAMIVWFITSWSLHRIFATDHLLRPWRVRSLCKMWGVCLCFQALYYIPTPQEMKKLNAHLTALKWQLDGSTTTWVWMMAISRVLHGRGITWRVVTTRSSKSSLRSLTGVFCSSAPRGFYGKKIHRLGLLLANRLEGASLQKQGWKGDASQGNAEVEWIDWYIDDIWNPKTWFFSWNMLRNV